MKTRVLIGIIAVLFIFSIINAYGVTREQDCLPDQELECAPCALGTIDCPCECVPKKTISPITNPEDEIKNNDTVQNNTLNNPECNGCVLNGKCLSFGLRQGGKYCSITGEFSEQKKGKEECDNNFECKSNVCVDGSCIEQGFFTRLMSWLKGLFKIAEKETEKKEPEKINEEKNENCEQVKKDITKELQKINYCSRNDECEYGLPDGVGPAEILYTCGVYYNKQADLTKLRELDNAHSKKNCPRRAMTSCLSRDSFDVVCVNKKCGMKIKTEQKSDCEKLCFFLRNLL
jgi:hypothetical protein